MIIKFKYHLLFYVFILSAVSIHADNFQKKQIDSLLAAGTKIVYENPDKSIEIAQSIFNSTTYSIESRTRALILACTAYTSKRDYKKALEHIIKAKEFSSKIDNKNLKIQILFMTGLQYQQLKIFDKSIEYMEEIEKESLTYPVRDSVGKILADSYLVKGFIYKDNLNCDIALEYFKKGILEYERLGSSVHNQSIGHYNKGNCYIILSDYDNAKESFNKSIELAKLENASSLVSFAEKGLAEVYTLEGKYEAAILLLQSALERAKNVGDLVLNLGVYKGLFENYLVLDESDKFQKYYELFSKTQLDIKKSERSSVSDSIKENSKNLNEEINQIQSQFKNRFKWLVLLIFIFIIILFFIERKNRNSIKTLQKKVESLQNTKSLTDLQ
ncbi:tetratricopeptide repeat protein [Lacinutrix himadriensis]|uniref:tetratricopeptide repeat protein n=1 Tax=Lacinutrix himadriensis TaxID=641549 RepID=UPI0009FA2FB2|nr:tetratricopeptide repeat protein [Lacinutrix himadriensis]